jgi:urease accessory protein
MMMKRLISAAAVLAAGLALTPGAALAHPGHGAGFVAGLLHPLTGPDHLLAMLAIGLWAAVLGGRAVWALPVTFVLALGAGGLAGHLAGVELPGVEQSILASLMILGVATALAWRAPLGLAVAGVAAFGAAHGLAHGAESPADVLPYAMGFVLASTALHGLGLGLARQPGLARALGLATALTGLALAVAG